MHRFVVSVVLLLLISGCAETSAPTAHLAGTVTIGGAPIPADADASMSFVRVTGGKGVTVPIVDGRYDSPQTPEGDVMVRFSISHSVGPVKKSEHGGVEYRDSESLVPQKYAGGTRLNVSGDNLSQDFDL